MVEGRQYRLHSYDQCGITRGTTFAAIWLLVFKNPTSQIFYQPEQIHTTSFTTAALVGGPSVIAVHYKRTKALFIQLYINPNTFLSSQELPDTFQLEEENFQRNVVLTLVGNEAQNTKI
ncbi:hypothetical protein TTHERM_00194080 (macronuclear) [Tetrahymena thermophila SB210]|uniref:Uncharacterized protein n=1 Tax=Tetrahymena thermophila (strain SB210) TaxID=312017 RepID=Q23KC7_TETTS|nr:hypothetical protein TTHERM_00194080 [Tetrahymena thermophila SB210]EAR96916.1 hypothetical protein TTHERM_00194080 [Tetrahymena thermophila SB210]|eukprot:XP_001017161.1 hypothetical protein TTHERM_00194080 [Tetrahymena thermophila SB210]